MRQLEKELISKYLRENAETVKLAGRVGEIVMSLPYTEMLQLQAAAYIDELEAMVDDLNEELRRAEDAGPR